LAGDHLTVEAWIRLEDSTGAWNPVLTQNISNGYGYYLGVSENKVHFSLVAGRDTVRVVSPDTVTAGQWYHIAGTNDGSNMKIYIDGRLKANVASDGRTGADHDAYIGYDYAVEAYYRGLIDDVRIYNRALSEKEFQSPTILAKRLNDKDSWRTSAYEGGSPGADDSGIIPNPGSVVINEIMAHSHSAAPDWIELYNTTDAEIDIGGWCLSDTEADLRKYEIAAGTKIKAHEYKLFYEDVNFGEFSRDPGSVTPFAFSENGDQFHLTGAKDGVLSGYREVEDFGASETDVSFGRYFKSSTGNYNFVPMDDDTPGQPNAYPKVGPVVISEIMYNPDWPDGGSYGNDHYEYIELHNVSGSPVTLYRADKMLPWKFTDGIEFTFPDYPNEVTIPKDGFVVVVEDPNAFAWRYPAVPSQIIFGPYTGSLDNGGETVEISLPGDVDKFGTCHYIRVDRVVYSDGSHPEDCPCGVDLWPIEADGGGPSLTRTSMTLYGNDPNNWISATPSAGTANP